jgi:hypothetical protein
LTATGRDPLGDRKDDLYETPPEAVYALLKAEYLPLRIWEPAAGKGAIVGVLRDTGRSVCATELQHFSEPGTTYGVDFLMEYHAPIGVQAIVTNPPFKLADEFTRHALRLVPIVIMLLRLAFLEGTGRSDIIEGPLRRVYLFRNRLPRMHRAGWTGPRASSSIAFAWFVFLRDELGPIELRRITWEELPA